MHFGGGALGRGLVIPLLVESGYDVILADVDEKLLSEIKEKGGYPLFVTDEEPERQRQFIPVLDTVSTMKEQKKLSYYLEHSSAVTTAVRRENLIHVAKSLLTGYDGNHMLAVICAENIEHVSGFMKGILEKAASSEEQMKKIPMFCIPDTIVDRICSSNWPGNLEVNSEMYHELAVDQKTLADTHIKLIPAIDNIEGAFVRKRLMVNTFADASSFFALAKGKTYLHEAIEDKFIQEELAPYFESFRILLSAKYNFSNEELDQWHAAYKKRLANPAIHRSLESVARNLWVKMALDERFVWPLLSLMVIGEDTDSGISVLVNLLKQSTGESNAEIQNKLEDLWGNTELGRKILSSAKRYL